MVNQGVIVEQHYGVWVAREDLCVNSCSYAPALAKMRGILKHIQALPDTVPGIGVVVTERTLNGWAVAAACKHLGLKCVVFYPSYTTPRPLPHGCKMAQHLCGATLIPIQAGRQSVMNAIAKKRLGRDYYMMPTALKLIETTEESYRMASATLRQYPMIEAVVVPSGTGTHLAGIDRACREASVRCYGAIAYPVNVDNLRHQGVTGELSEPLSTYDTDAVCPTVPPFPGSPYYEAWAWAWLCKQPWLESTHTLFWNIGQ